MFEAPAQHPHSAGISSMSSNEEGEADMAIIPTSATAVPISTTPVDNLTLYTACNRGFVKIWKIGEPVNPAETNAYVWDHYKEGWPWKVMRVLLT